MEDPCKNCPDRQWYARRLDMHFWGDDCPYECEEYEHYKKMEEKKSKQGFHNAKVLEKQFIEKEGLKPNDIKKR